ncbi:MAG: NRDE family protein [Pseudomonadota bacterium]
MCLIGLSWQKHPRYALIVAANRDEFHARQTDPLAWWPGVPVLAGCDRVGGGTWMGISRSGLFAALTNFREPVESDHADPRPSRGELVINYLTGHTDPRDAPEAYAGFNLLTGCLRGPHTGLHFATNRGEPRTALAPGIYGLSNGQFDAPWPKARALKAALHDLPHDPLAEPTDIAETLLATLTNQARVQTDEDLPKTGMDVALERRLSAAFILGEHYGTRCSTVLLVDRDGMAWITEWTFAPDGRCRFSRRFLWRLVDTPNPQHEAWT